MPQLIHGIGHRPDALEDRIGGRLDDALPHALGARLTCGHAGHVAVELAVVAELDAQQARRLAAVHQAQHLVDVRPDLSPVLGGLRPSALDIPLPVVGRYPDHAERRLLDDLVVHCLFSLHG